MGFKLIHSSELCLVNVILDTLSCEWILIINQVHKACHVHEQQTLIEISRTQSSFTDRISNNLSKQPFTSISQHALSSYRIVTSNGAYPRLFITWLHHVMYISTTIYNSHGIHKSVYIHKVIYGNCSHI